MSIFVESLMRDLKVSPDAVWKYTVEYTAPFKRVLVIGQPIIYLASPEDFCKADCYTTNISWVTTPAHAPHADEFRRTHRNGMLYVCEDLTQFNTDQFDAVAIFDDSRTDFIQDMWRIVKEGAPMVIAGKQVGQHDHERLISMGASPLKYNEEFGYWICSHRKDQSTGYTK